MTLEQARNLLITCNRWRRGEDVEPPLDPHYIGKAIDVAIDVLEGAKNELKPKQNEKRN